MGLPEPVESNAEDVIASQNPATGVTIGQVPVRTAHEVADAVARARLAQRSWGVLPPAERARRVMALRDAFLEHADDLVALLVQEMGKTRQEALVMELLPLVDLTDYFCRRADELLSPRPIKLRLMKTKRSYLHYVPRGVVGIISPWNFPLTIPMGETVMALLAGNAVVLKPSEITPLIALRCKDLFDASGMPKELFQVVTGRGETGAALVQAGVDQVVFTGSVATGKKVAVACAEKLVPCTLELGGKAPAIVCADADIERTANALLWGGFGNSGQMCCSVERVYAHEAIHDQLVQKLDEKTRQLRQGDPSRKGIDVGPMAWKQQLSTVEEAVKGAIAAGARLVTGGKRKEGKGMFYEPTVLADCRQDMDIMHQEFFGPVVPVMRVNSDEEALQLANDSHLGLLGYVFTRDRDKGQRLAERMQVGTVMVNDVVATFGMPETPWHGLKQSGLGITHSDDGLRELCQKRHVNVDRIAPAKELWWYPYSENRYKLFLRGLRLLYR